MMNDTKFLPSKNWNILRANSLTITDRGKGGWNSVFTTCSCKTLSRRIKTLQKKKWYYPDHSLTGSLDHQTLTGSNIYWLIVHFLVQWVHCSSNINWLNGLNCFIGLPNFFLAVPITQFTLNAKMVIQGFVDSGRYTFHNAYLGLTT